MKQSGGGGGGEGMANHRLAAKRVAAGRNPIWRGRVEWPEIRDI